MSLSREDLRAVAAILRDVGRAEIMPLFRKLQAVDVRSKTGPLDLVTVADERAETAIAAALTQRFPGCAVVGEEAASADPALLHRLGDADLTFVVDPIDGTSNFAAGLPLFGVMVAALRRGEIAAAGDEAARAAPGDGAPKQASSEYETFVHRASPENGTLFSPAERKP